MTLKKILNYFIPKILIQISFFDIQKKIKLNKHKKIILYSRFIKGLGHLSRISKLANKIAKEFNDIEVIILTDTLNVPRIDRRVKIVKIPSFEDYISKNNLVKLIPHNKLNKAYLNFRSEILYKLSKFIKPKMYFIDFRPKGEEGELIKTITQNYKKIKFQLIMRDIFQGKKRTLQLWNKDDFGNFINEYYDKILIFGDKTKFDFTNEYDLKLLDRKIMYLGYLVEKINIKSKPKNKIIFTVGSGHNKENIIENICAKLDKLRIKNIIVITGISSSDERISTIKHKYPKVKFIKHSPNIFELYSQARLILSSGGYNSTTEIMGTNIPAIIIPEINLIDKEQLIRSKLLSKNKVLEYHNYEKQDEKDLAKKINNSKTIAKNRSRNLKKFNKSGYDSFFNYIKKSNKFF